MATLKRFVFKFRNPTHVGEVALWVQVLKKGKGKAKHTKTKNIRKEGEQD